MKKGGGRKIKRETYESRMFLHIDSYLKNYSSVFLIEQTENKIGSYVGSNDTNFSNSLLHIGTRIYETIHS